MSVIETVKSFIGIDRATDVRSLLHADHEEILSLARDMSEAETATTRKGFFKSLQPLLTRHARAEEQAVYMPLLEVRRSKDTNDLGNEGFVEHSLVDVLLARLAKVSMAGSDAWKAHAMVLKEILEHHIQEEERDTFKALGNHFNDEQRDAMGQAFDRKRGEGLKRR